jgi:RND family efflux transporter MFP subunit
MIRPFLVAVAGLVLAGLLAAGLALFLVPSMAASPADAKPSVLVETTPLRKGSLPRIVRAYGVVQASASARQAIMAPVAAIVGELDVRPGEEVAAGAPLLRLLPSPTTNSAYARARSALRVAIQRVGRTRQMLSGHLATGQQLADAEQAESNARAALAALDAEGAAGPNTLQAPFQAIVVDVTTSPGAIVAEGSRLLDLVRPAGLVLNAGIVPTQAVTIEPGDPAAISALGAHGTVAGRVALRGAFVDAASGLVPVEIDVPAGEFLSGERAEAAITTGRSQGYVVPHQAILVNDSGAAYVVQAKDGVATEVAVRILGSAGDEDVIDGPLDAASPLVLAGAYQLQNGMKVRVADPAGKAGR